jgi:DNA-binding transcriptional ArsR family regulator
MFGSVRLAAAGQFDHNRTVVVDAFNEELASRIAAAIGEPARARMLYCLMDSRARTSTELAIVADVSLPTASAHLNRLKDLRLVRVRTQGRYRYYTLDGLAVADVLEKLSVLAGSPRDRFVPSTPSRLREARTCYDHIAGTLGVSLHDRLEAMGWLNIRSAGSDVSYELTSSGAEALAALGLDVEAARLSRRKFAFACLDWSERRSHVGGALGAALLRLALSRKWVALDLDSRALRVSDRGRRELLSRFGLRT